MLWAIVDAYSSGRFLAEVIRRHEMDCVHVQSSPEISPFFLASFQPQDFTENILHDGSARRTAGTLAALGVGCVLPGAETGVELAEALTALLGLPGNDPQRPGGRRDKAIMARLLSGAGLDAPAGLRTTDPAAAVAWATSRGAWPVVAKPVASAASDSVFVCPDAPSLADAVSAIMSRENVLCQHNDAALVQEFLSGTEYAVNSVSRGGRHHFAEVWRYAKRPVPPAAVVYDYEEPVPFTDPAVAVITGYLGRALTALGVRYGPAHSEVMLTSRGPVLLETGARLAGMVLPAVMTEYFGLSQADLAVQAMTDPAGFDATCDRPYATRGYLRNVFLISPQAGTLARDDQFRLLRQLPGFAGMSISARAGSRLQRTVDLGGSPGHVYLMAGRPDQITAGYRRIRELEATTLYPLTDPAAAAPGMGMVAAQAPLAGTSE